MKDIHGMQIRELIPVLDGSDVSFFPSHHRNYSSVKTLTTVPSILKGEKIMIKRDLPTTHQTTVVTAAFHTVGRLCREL